MASSVSVCNGRRRSLLRIRAAPSDTGWRAICRLRNFLPQLEFGLGKVAFARSDWKEAEERFRHVAEAYPKSDIASEALYWAGVSKYKHTQDPSALAETAAALRSRYPDSVWTKKASVWEVPAAS
jgi:TolA-binding protein